MPYTLHPKPCTLHPEPYKDDCPDAHSGEQGNARVRYERAAVPYGDRCVAELETRSCLDGQYVG
jgi:hypothetical protein